MENSKVEEGWWGLIIVPIIVSVLSASFWQTIRDNSILRWPLIILFFLTGFIVWHIIIAFQKNITDKKKETLRRVKAWFSGVLSLVSAIILFTFLINPIIHNEISSIIFSNSEQLPIQKDVEFEETEETYEAIEMGVGSITVPSIPELDDGITQGRIIFGSWFTDNCISRLWYFFNLDGIIREGCWSFTPSIISGKDDGFTINYLGTTKQSFLLYQYIPEYFSKISFYFQVFYLETEIDRISTDFYFGFLPGDLGKLYPSGPLSHDNMEFNGEFVIVRGIEKESTYGYVYQGQNTYLPYYRTSNDIDVKTNYIYKVEIEIIGNMWNVIIENVSTGQAKDQFFRSGLDQKGRYFSFGARIPVGGTMNVRVFDFNME